MERGLYNWGFEVNYQLRKLIALVGILVLSAATSKADWITEGYYSDAAGIDSLERFLIIRDIIDSTYLGYDIVPLGDINGDNLSDVLIIRADFLPGQDHNGFLYYGGNAPDSCCAAEFTNFTINLQNIGDINSDGYDDMAQCDGIWRKYYIFYGGPNIDDSADKVIEGVYTKPNKAADIDGDGVLDIILTENRNGGDVYVFKLGDDFDSEPDFIISDTASFFGSRVTTVDFNGDAFPDIAVSAFLNRDSCFVKFYWGGPDFDTTPDFEIYGFDNRLGEYLLPVGDFNGDGYEDIYIGGSSSKRYGIYYGGPDFDDKIDVVTNHNYGTSYNEPYAVDVVGDINSDGYPDFIYSQVIYFLTEIFILLGGPDADSLYDINIENYDMPGPQNTFGTALAGIGDFNGDGIDDFAVRSQTEPYCCWRSEVNFFAGWDGSGPCDCEPGNSNGDETIDIFDLTRTISYLYLGGPAPTPYELCNGDPNKDCICNIFDFTFTISYLYLNGPPPVTCEQWRTVCGQPLRE